MEKLIPICLPGQYLRLKENDMYKVGDYVICQSGGIWQITDTGLNEYTLSAHEKNLGFYLLLLN